MNIIKTVQEKYHFLNMCSLCRYARFSQAQSHIICMPCYVALSNVLYLMHMKMYIQYSLIRRLASYKVHMLVYYCIARVVIVIIIVVVIFRQGVHSVLYGIFVNFMGIDFCGFCWVSYPWYFMKLYIATWCLRYNICRTWLLDIRKSTCSCFSSKQKENDKHFLANAELKCNDPAPKNHQVRHLHI